MASTVRSSSPPVESKNAYVSQTPSELSFTKEQNQASSDVKWKYLTYETILPDFTALNNNPSAPQPPNLKKYDSPFGWTTTRKNICVAFCTFATFLAAYSAGVYSFAATILKARWSLSQLGYNTGVTAWCTGFAVVPMFIAPFSEINGRRPIFLASSVVFLVSDIGCAVTSSFAGMVVARFFQGAGASTFSTMVGGVISDVYHSEKRNTPMAIYSAGAFLGTGFGPLLGGFIIARVDWKWTWWTHSIVLGIFFLLSVISFKETRGSVLLSRKARIVNKYYDELDEYTRKNHPQLSAPSQSIRFKVAADENRATISHMLYLSTTTPFKFLATEPVVFFFSLFAAFAWAVLFMAFSVIPLVFQTTYNYNITQQAATFTAIIAGTIIALMLSIYEHAVLSITPFAKRLKSAPADPSERKTFNPESRLYLPCILSPCLPIGLFWFGWTARPSVHWIVPTIALGVAFVGIFTIYLAVFNYLADVYHRYASSALAAQSFCRNLLAALFPLFVNQMFTRLGYGGAGSLLGGLGTLLTLVPWVLVWKGEEILSRSKVASEFSKTGQ